MHVRINTFTKNIILLVLAVWCYISTAAQTYNNEWIDFGKTYYKFKIIKTGMYRIPVSTLQTAGLDAIPAENFALFRNGQEQPIYTSAQTGALPVNGYIEFYGIMNDGAPDKALYRNPAFQHTTAYSLFSDTATYFLVVRPSVQNLRFTSVTNDVSNPQQQVEPYFMYTSATYFRDKINDGTYQYAGEFVYSSSFDKGEFFSSGDLVQKGGTKNTTLSNLFVYTGSAPDASIKYGAFSNSIFNKRRIDVKVNSNVVSSVQLDNLNDAITTTSFPVSKLNTASTPVAFVNMCDSANDRVVVSYFELTYPRQFNFGNSNLFPFTLEARAQGYYLEITNFNWGNTAPVLYDITTNKRYIGSVTGSGSTAIIKFSLPPSSSATNFVLASQVSGITTVSNLALKRFVDFSNPSNQGDFLIITNPALYEGSSGNNPVEDYASYRSSANGGGFNTKIVEMDELIDQFAFGIYFHPSSIKNFIAYSRNKFSSVPRNVLLIGKGVHYKDAWNTRNNANLKRLNFVPTFGWPASDNLFSADGVVEPAGTVPIGRLSVINGSEIEDYLQKVQEYETAQRTAPHTIADRLWMKNVLELTGADDESLGPALCQYVNSYKKIIEDTLAGTNVTVFCKISVNSTGQDVSRTISDLFGQGLSLITYFGHSAASTLDFNLDNPMNYNNLGKYPIFSANGCNAGNDFNFNASRLTTKETISEKFTLAKQRGAIAFVASTHFGIVQYLHPYLAYFNTYISSTDYGKTLGEINRDALKDLYYNHSSDFARFQAEQNLIHGDPALRFNSQLKPDYVIEEPQVLISPSFISLAEGNCKAFIKLYNLGKAVNDSIILEVKHLHPDGSSSILYRKKMRGIYYCDSLDIPIPIIASKDKGTNKLVITIEADNAVEEMSESNNSITKEFFVYEDEIRPVFPYNYSIVNVQGQKLYASTSNPFSTLRDYVVEIDTTKLFNSSLKRLIKVNSAGGIVEFTPGFSYKDSTVYYWRVSQVPQEGDDYRWNDFSFIYLSKSTSGFNQSHYYQHLGSTTDSIMLASNRLWEYSTSNIGITASGGVFGGSILNAVDFYLTSSRNSNVINVCGFGIIFNVFDPKTFKVWFNAESGQPGRYNSGTICGAERINNFQFDLMTQQGRINAYNFMDSIPDKSYVVVRVLGGTPNVGGPGITFAKDWQNDTSVLGHNQSLYHKLLGKGFYDLDSFNITRGFIFIYKNNDNSFVPKSAFSKGVSDKVNLSITGAVDNLNGFITSPLFGPAVSWKQLHWRGKSAEVLSKDSIALQIIGVDNLNHESVLFNLNISETDYDISSIDAKQYPYLKLRLFTKDTAELTPYQLDYWRLNYEPAPEGAISPNIYFKFKDTLDLGEKLPLSIAFKNISPYKFDSLLLKMTITDKDNVTRTISLPRVKPLISGDTVTLRYDVDTKDIPGNNTLYVNFNPDYDQPEQYLYNNFMYRNFYVKPDNINPMLDVTFDGVHILNKDIVSAKPHILIKLQDNAKHMLLNDTSLLKIRVKFPSPDGGITPGEVRTYKYDNDIVKFIPAQSASDNTARIEFTPFFEDTYSSDGDFYELILTGKDQSGNSAGEVDYRIGFTVISKPMISNLLNYPNPFTTSTAFVFTITGSEIPQQFKIQILTVTGKVVREITKEELGPLHIGRNITEFKWDGTDQFGQRLANGVYIYRVVTTLNGNKMEKYKANGDNTDNFFKGGYGKMYLMK